MDADLVNLREVEYTDERGRHWAVLIPRDAPDSHAPMGMTVGPADVDPLGLPEKYATALHNALYRRRILTYDNAKRHPGDVLSALREAMAIGAQEVISLYAEGGADILALKPTEDASAAGETR